MRRILVIGALAIGLAGCNEERPSPPPPTIQVEQSDTTEFTGVTITYRSHTRPQNSDPYTQLRTPEEVRDYKKQVEFLLLRLEEAEKRMNVHEPEPTGEPSP